mgnify:CR=1 FL=1|tara:strand:- start:28028 stop:28849 length:822 start_codon:yes stop_codon:yes gene_type:complete
MLKKIILTMSLLPSLVFANETFVPSVEFKKTIATYLTPSFVKTATYFKAELGFIGVGVVTNQYKKMVFYTDETASFLINGNLINTSSGEQLTAKYNSEIALDLSDIANEFEGAKGFVQGQGENTVYVVVDANCGYCHKTYQSFQAQLAKSNKNLKIKWVPVGFLGEDSLNKGNIMASATDNDEGLALMKDFMSRSSAKPNSAVTAEGQAMLSNNALIMQKYGYNGVPLVVSKVDGEWFLFNGLPRPNYFAKLSETIERADVAKNNIPETTLVN